MNSVERVHTALKRKQPDRVPVIEFVVDEKVAKAAVPGCRDVADCMDQLDMDNVGCGAYFETVQRNADGSFIDEWGITYLPSEEAVAHPLRGPIVTMDDARTYTPPDPDAKHRLGKLPELVERYKGKRAICFHHRAAFMWSAYLMGLDNILLNLLAEPELVTLVMDKVLKCNMQIVRRAIRAGAEIIVLGDDYAGNHGPMMSPALFRQFILPRLKQMVDLIHDEGAFCIKHSDGDLYPLLEMIVSAGPDGINPVEPQAGMELKRVKQLVGHKVCITGNIDCAHLLPHGTVDEVRAAVRQAIADAAPDGGYILTSSNSIHSSCKPENFIAMIQACKEFGKYPLQLEQLNEGTCVGSCYSQK
ncbi:MAG: uroporphyrinogen decarboxylase family protein [Kiritimatiellae bacterium]|nr:uroporphyrinogen decarboxylase family protein [Kiritimatiellia bacterium]MDD5519792.1 uroporphyrinogen decarboxylase family protein [Kiritimatiellia bacterium]